MLKKLLILGCAVILMCGRAYRSFAQSINTVIVTTTAGAVPTGGFCLGNQARVSFAATGFTPAPSSFTVELSDASGVFGSPTNLGTGAASPITVTLPSNVAGSSTYKIRVRVNAVSGQSPNFTINPRATVNNITSVEACDNASAGPINFSSPSAGATFSWTSTANVGFGTSGNGNIGSFTANNNGSSNVTATVTVTPSVNGCVGTSNNFTVTVKPSPTVNSISNISGVCNGSGVGAINFSSSTSGTTFAWTSTTNVGFGTSGNGNIAGFTATNATSNPVTATVTVTPTANGCTGTPTSFTVTVNPTNATVNAISNANYCNNASGAAINFSSPSGSATFDWTSNINVGFGTSGSGNISAYTASNGGTSDVVATVTVTPKIGGCAGTQRSFSVTVKPTPTVNTISDVSFCNGVGGSAINFGSPTAGTTFTWASSTSVGFGTSGSGNIPAFTATNGTANPLVATVSVTPTANSCTGPARTFNVTVNPTASVNAISDASFCGGVPVSGINFTSPTSGASFSWASSANVGFGTSGSGNIGGYTTISDNTTAVVSTITVTPSINGCPGSPRTFTITINPRPTVNTVSNVTYCNGAAGSAINFSGPVTGTTFNWTSSINSGFGTSGSGNIAAFTASNGGTNSVANTVSVTPTTGTCTGPATTFTVTVNPTPVVNSISNATFCGNAAAPSIPFSSATPGTSYAWTSSTNVGFGTSGSGNIPNYTAIDGSPTAVVSTISVTPTANTCVGSAQTFTVTVNPSPRINDITNAVFCNNASAPAIGFSSPTSGATFNWVSNANVGFGASGTGNIAAYTAVNIGATPVVATVNITAQTATCTGPSRSFNVTVNPTPTVNTINNLTLCGGTGGAPINFGSPTPGTTFAWTSTADVGFGGSGSGNVGGYTVTSPVTSAVTATVTINPTADGCAGKEGKFTITVNPTPRASLPNPNQICANSTGVALNFSSETPNTNFNWSSSNDIGFGTSGSGNINGGYRVINNSQDVLTATISVVASTANCTASAQQFTYRVNPTPGNPSAPSPIFYCNTAVAQPLTANGQNLKWYSQPTEGTWSGLAITPSTNTVGTTSYYVSQTNQYECESPRSEIKVTTKPLPPFPAVSKQEYLLCQFDPQVELDAKLAGTGQSLVWILPNNTGETNVAPVIKTDVGFEGTYSVLQVLDGCRGGRTDIKVNVRTTPLPTVTSAPVVSCQNSAPQPLSATGDNLKWYNTNKTGGTPQNTPNIPPTQTPGTYQFYVTQTGSNGCESPRAEITVVIKPLPSATLSGGSNITQGQSAPLSIVFTGDAPWTYTLSNGVTLSTSQNPTTISVSPLDTTTYIITKVTNNCGEGTPAGSAVINVKVAIIDVGNPSVTNLCAGTSFTMPYFSSDFFPSNTQFKVQISKTPEDAGFQTITTEGNSSPLRGILPNTTTAGNYYVRVVGIASNFTVKGKISPVQITARELPTATISGPPSVYENESAKIAIAFTGEVPWTITYNDSLSRKDTSFTTSVTPYEFSVKPGQTNAYKVVSITNGCGNGPANSRFVLIVNPVLGVNPGSGAEWLKVYPVPVQARCTVEIEGPTGVTLTVVDGFGRVILRQQTTSSRDELDFTNIHPGEYFLNAERNGEIARRKILKIQ